MEVEGVFKRSWRLLTGNAIIILPGLLVAIGSGILTWLIVPPRGLGDTGPFVAPNLLADALLFAISLSATFLSITYTTGMANAAWERGRATFADGATAFRREGGHVLVALLIMIVLGFAATALAPFTLLLSLLGYTYFGIYTMASAVVGERTGFEAIAESARTAYHRPTSTILMVFGLVVVVVLMGVLAAVLHGVPLVGPLVAQIVVQAVIAFLTLVVVGEYRIATAAAPTRSDTA
ncbi:MAG: hypothetical protein ACREM8_08720 [Vulcanimicrobiaceae bacterium]